MKTVLLPVLLACLLALPATAGTVVRFATVLGDFEVELDDAAAPRTVANFLSYLRRGDYNSSFFHRSVPGFVLQGGGFTLRGNQVFTVTPEAPVPNEPGISNLRGTLAMAKLGGLPDSATCQWFINLGDNSGNLDNQNGGFTVFGRVLGTGMAVVDALAAAPAYNASAILGSPFSELPLLAPVLAPENLLGIRSIQVVPFAVTSVRRDGAGVTVQWSGSGSTPVQVERSTSPDAPVWTVISSNNTTGVHLDPAPPAGRAFYRVVQP